MDGKQELQNKLIHKKKEKWPYPDRTPRTKVQSVDALGGCLHYNGALLLQRSEATALGPQRSAFEITGFHPDIACLSTKTVAQKV